MTTTHHIKVNGQSYKVTTTEDGTETYDPPLPSSVEAWFYRSKLDRKAGLAPKLKTDSTFNAGRMSMRDQFQGDDPWLNRFNKEYRKQTGSDLPSDGVWMGQLADSPFDAKAVVKSEAEVKKLIQRRQDKHQREADAPPIRLAEDLVRSKMKEYRKQGDKSEASELRQMVIEKHGRKV